MSDTAVLVDCLKVSARLLAQEAVNHRYRWLFQAGGTSAENQSHVYLNAAARCLRLAEKYEKGTPT